MNNKHSIDPSHQSTSKHTHGFVKHTRNLSVVLCLGMLAGVLIWSKLRLVTDIPRSAYADPRETMIPDDQSVQSDLADETGQNVTGASEQSDAPQDSKTQEDQSESIPEIETPLPEESEGAQHPSQSPE